MSRLVQRKAVRAWKRLISTRCRYETHLLTLIDAPLQAALHNVDLLFRRKFCEPRGRLAVLHHTRFLSLNLLVTPRAVLHLDIPREHDLGLRRVQNKGSVRYECNASKPPSRSRNRPTSVHSSAAAYLGIPLLLGVVDCNRQGPAAPARRQRRLSLFQRGGCRRRGQPFRVCLRFGKGEAKGWKTG